MGVKLHKMRKNSDSSRLRSESTSNKTTDGQVNWEMINNFRVKTTPMP